MREHIAHLESELAGAMNQLAITESRGRAFEQPAIEAITVGDFERLQETIAAHTATWDALDEEVGVLKADIRVLRALLAACQEWLQASEAQAAG